MEKISLMDQLLLISPAGLQTFLKRHESSLIRSDRPFTDYMRAKFRENDISEQNVFLSADLSERYGYKLISGEKRTRQRDVILRLCLSAEFHLDEVREALMLYGMSPLHDRIPRDMAFIVAFNKRIFEIHDVDAILRDNNLSPFLTLDDQLQLQ